MPESQLGAPRWKDWFWRLYNFAPPFVDEVRLRVSPAVALLRNLRVPLVLFRGSSLARTETAAIAAGDERWSAGLARRFFSAEPVCKPLGSVPVYNLPKVLREWAPRVELVVARVDRITAGRFSHADYLTLPGSLSLLMPVPENVARLNRLNDNVREDLRRIRKNDLTYEVSLGFDYFDEFYDRYHIPFMRNRHGFEAVVRNRYLMRRFIHQGGVLWITRDGQRIAGCAFGRQNREICLVASGVDNGRIEIVRLGALAAIYYYAACYAIQEGCSQIEFGSTAPFLNDGLFQYKRKWQPNIALADNAYTAIMHWPKMSDAMAAFLADSPLIFREGDKVSALTALRGPGPAALEQAVKLFSQLAVPGLHRFWIISKSGWQSPENTQMLGQTQLKMVQTFHPKDTRS